MAALKAFQEPTLVVELLDETEFEKFESRQMRYSIFWGFFENSAYREIHSWARRYKHLYGLYRYIRNIYSPAHRLGEFWQTFLMGGLLDPDVGDGTAIASAMPVITENEALRPAIARLWNWSNWQVNKDILSLYGPVFGDVGLRVVDDPDREKVYLEVVHPKIIKDVTLDPFGNVKAYTIEESRQHPDNPNQSVTYTEVADRDGDEVIYITYLNGKEYAWNGEAAEWTEPYGFIPMRMIQHNNVGLEWGWSEMQPGLSRFHELDDLASMIHDQIRKAVNPIWLFAGVDKPSGSPTTTKSSATTDRPEPGREETDALYGGDSAKAQALVANVDIANAAERVSELLEDLEREFPELRDDISTGTGEITGRALRIRRQPTVNKVLKRRANYDEGVRRAHQMAIAIAGYRGYEDFGGFGLDSYGAGDLDFHIGERPVFEADPLDDAELDEVFWRAAKTAVEGGMPLVAYLKHKGWSDDNIAAIQEELDKQISAQAEAQAVQSQANAANALEVVGRALGGGRQPPPGAEPVAPEEGEA